MGVLPYRVYGSRGLGYFSTSSVQQNRINRLQTTAIVSGSLLNKIKNMQCKFFSAPNTCVFILFYCLLKKMTIVVDGHEIICRNQDRIFNAVQTKRQKLFFLAPNIQINKDILGSQKKFTLYNLTNNTCSISIITFKNFNI